MQTTLRGDYFKDFKKAAGTSKKKLQRKQKKKLIHSTSTCLSTYLSKKRENVRACSADKTNRRVETAEHGLPYGGNSRGSFSFFF